MLFPVCTVQLVRASEALDLAANTHYESTSTRCSCNHSDTGRSMEEIPFHLGSSLSCFSGLVGVARHWRERVTVSRVKKYVYVANDPHQLMTDEHAANRAAATARCSASRLGCEFGRAPPSCGHGLGSIFCFLVSLQCTRERMQPQCATVPYRTVRVRPLWSLARPNPRSFSESTVHQTKIGPHVPPNQH